MRPTEVVMLTGYLRAHFPSQPVDEYTTEALEELLARQAAYGSPKAALMLFQIAAAAPAAQRQEITWRAGSRIPPGQDADA